MDLDKDTIGFIGVEIVIIIGIFIFTFIWYREIIAMGLILVFFLLLYKSSETRKNAEGEVLKEDPGYEGDWI